MTVPTTEDVPLAPLVPEGTAVGSLSADQVAALSAAVRAHCGWHIAPVLEQDLVLDCDGGRVLHLPTLRLVSVSLVEDLSGATPVALSGWRQSPAGMLSRAEGWPEGFSSVRVVFRHGYATTPPELVPVLASVAQRRVKRESLAGRSIELDDYEAQLHRSVLDRFRIEARP